MRNVLLLAACFLMLGATGPKDDVVRYQMAPALEGKAITGLNVSMRLRADASGTTRIAWPSAWAGVDRLSQWARDFAVSGASEVDTEPNGTRVIRSAPGATITITYRIVSGFSADPSVKDNRQPVPIIRPAWFYAVGEALFARPYGQGDDKRRAQFEWTGPSSIGFASDLQHHGGQSTLQDISESIIIGGRDLHIAASGPAGRQIRIARVGTYAFDGASFDALAGKVVEAERDFWMAPEEPFLVTMVPLAPSSDMRLMSGTGRGDAFALWVDASTPIEDLASLLAHEYFHTWNPARLGAPSPPPEAQGYWLSEGFTDFYARRIMLRAGLIKPQQFADQWNEVLFAYASSTFRTASNRLAADKFWSDDGAHGLPYQRGAMLAAIWDLRLRSSGTIGGLDAILLKQAREVSASETKPYATDQFIRTAREYGLDATADMANYLDAGKPVLLPPNAFGRCAKVVTEDRPVFDRGWDVARTTANGGLVTGLDPKSPAYAAGLREGMKILERVSGVLGDATIEYAVRVSDGKTERVIRFMPAGARTVMVQTLVLDRDAFSASPDSCRQGLAG